MSAQIGRITAALAAATNEVTVAAAKLNFDFTLVKIEAPKEYHPLGECLSKKRKHEAEHGSTHVTARRLGALFEDINLPTPSLVKAYGSRVSEISRSIKEKDLHGYTRSIFSEYEGVDGTSIWAAATSSKAAIHVHLLNCMLARMWTAPEAVAIWVELISERKKSIAERFDHGEPFAFPLLAAACQQEITVSQLREWDNSARAWLEVADMVKTKEQTQLTLILKNVRKATSSTTEIFRNVIEAWKLALQTLENLVNGVPQAVEDGAILLAISAWHLYPTLAVFGDKSVTIKSEDKEMIEGGILTLGLSKCSIERKGVQDESENGVYWSLSLAHLKHYGRPKIMTRSLKDPRRISYDDFLVAIIGAMLEFWETPPLEERSVLALLAALFKQGITPMSYETRGYVAHYFSSESGVNLTSIFNILERCLQAEGKERENVAKLINLGRRRMRFIFGLEAGSFNMEMGRFGNTTENISLKHELPYFGLLASYDEGGLASSFMLPSLVQNCCHRAEKVAQPRLCMECLTQLLFDKSVDLRSFFSKVEQFSELYPLLQALSTVQHLYRSMPHATVSLRALENNLLGLWWVEKLRAQLVLDVAGNGDNFTRDLQKEALFAALAYFDAGVHVAETALGSVFAMSSGNSIYIIEDLLRDPIERCHGFSIQHILGNVGKAGVAFLKSPEVPHLTRGFDRERWRNLEGATFTGTPENCFGHTSIHLSLTSYELPLYSSSDSSGYFSQSSIVEAVFSVFDKGQWVADIDIMKVIWQSNMFFKFSCTESCAEVQKSPVVVEIDAVECWDDVLDPPTGSFVVKAFGDWLARLALLCALRNNTLCHKKTRFYIVNQNLCSGCWQRLSEKCSEARTILVF